MCRHSADLAPAIVYGVCEHLATMKHEIDRFEHAEACNVGTSLELCTMHVMS